MDICQIATKVISGEQALAAFRVYRTERIFILCDSFLTQSGAIDLLTRQIAPTNQVQVFDDVVPDPNLSGVARAMAAAVDFQPTVLVAFGGGAAIDTAKGLVYFASGAHAFSRPPVFIVIPTTSGTGSEMTSFAVITDAEEKQKIGGKYDRFTIGLRGGASSLMHQADKGNWTCGGDVVLDLQYAHYWTRSFFTRSQASRRETWVET